MKQGVLEVKDDGKKVTLVLAHIVGLKDWGIKTVTVCHEEVRVFPETQVFFVGGSSVSVEEDYEVLKYWLDHYHGVSYPDHLKAVRSRAKKGVQDVEKNRNAS
jgi:hypothetical protein